MYSICPHDVFANVTDDIITIGVEADNVCDKEAKNIRDLQPYNRRGLILDSTPLYSDIIGIIDEYVGTPPKLTKARCSLCKRVFINDSKFININKQEHYSVGPLAPYCSKACLLIGEKNIHNYDLSDFLPSFTLYDRSRPCLATKTCHRCKKSFYGETNIGSPCKEHYKCHPRIWCLRTIMSIKKYWFERGNILVGRSIM
jgi:hypothetical protein